MIRTISKFATLIIFIFVFLYFKNYTKITKNELQNLKNDYEKNLYKKIHEIKKYYSSVGRDENFEESLKKLSFCKSEVNEFFENVIVNDNDETIKKNRLELLSMLCKSFDNYFNFSKIEG